MIDLAPLMLAASLQHLHGTILTVDVKHHQAVIHHDPLAAMPAMTMVVNVPSAADLAKLKKGAVVDADVDTAKDPWILSHVKIVKQP